MGYAVFGLLILMSYVLGAIPFGIVIGRRITGVDVRQRGSGNIGTANVLRSLGVKPAILVLLMDVAKGAIPVLVGRAILSSVELGALAPFLGLVAVIGHNWSVFLQFRGGKGVATTAGVSLAVMPSAALAAIGVFALVVVLSRYASLGSMIGVTTLPVFGGVFGYRGVPLVVAVLLAAIALVRHRANIGRLLSGTELTLGDRTR